MKHSAGQNLLKDVPGAIDGHSHLYDEDGYTEKFLEACERVGIARSIVCALRDKAILDNARTLKAAARYPDRLIPFAFIQLGQDKPGAVVAAKRQGFRGLKFIEPPFAYDDERAFPLYGKAEELGLPALFHCGILTYARGVVTNSEFMRPMRLDGIARRFPGFRMQIAHLGVPEYEIATTLARMAPNISVDMTGNPSHGWYSAKSPSFIKSLFYWPNWHRKLIFGTDVRWQSMAVAVQIHASLLSALRPSAEMKRFIYRDNAREFLGEKAPES